MGSKLRRKVRQHSRQKGPSEFQALRERVREGLDVNVVGESADGIKMSEVLKAFVWPYVEFVDTEQALRRVLTIGVLAWNASLMPRMERAAMLKGGLGLLPPDMQADAEGMIGELMRRKERYFAEYRRMILDFEVVPTEEEFRLAVISTHENTQGGGGC